MQARTIDEVITHLDTIISWSREHNSPAGYFASLYRGVTIAVKEGIAAGRFVDGPRMERLDVIFANRYLEAWTLYQAGEKPSKSWRIAFNATRKKRYTILQHLLLGINAHINLDLGIAAAQTIEGQPIDTIEPDFIAINELLGEMVEAVQQKINAVSPSMRLLDALTGKADEKLAAFSVSKARKNAWRVACRFAKSDPTQHDSLVREEDLHTVTFARLLQRPGLQVSTILRAIRLVEKKRVNKVLDALA